MAPPYGAYGAHRRCVEGHDGSGDPPLGYGPERVAVKKLVRRVPDPSTAF